MSTPRTVQVTSEQSVMLQPEPKHRHAAPSSQSMLQVAPRAQRTSQRDPLWQRIPQVPPLQFTVMLPRPVSVQPASQTMLH